MHIKKNIKNKPFLLLTSVIFSVILLIILIYCFSLNTISIKKGNDLLEAGDYLGARIIYTKIFEKKPNNFSAHYGLGMSYCSEALYKTELALAVPDDWYLAIYHMTIAMNIRDIIEVRKVLAILHYNLGASYKKNEDYGNAMVRLEQAMQYDPTLIKAMNLLGAMYHEIGRLEDAERCYIQTIEVQPDYAMAHFNLGAIAWVYGDFEKASEYFQNAVDLSPYVSLFETWLEKAHTEIGNE